MWGEISCPHSAGTASLSAAEQGAGGRALHLQKSSPMEALFAGGPSVQASGVGKTFHVAGITPAEGGFAESVS